MKKIGYISEMKSVISEFTQYGIGISELEKLVEEEENFGALKQKLSDVLLIFKAFRDEIDGSSIIPEEVLDVLAGDIEISSILKGSVVAFDGFTGFTPIQYGVLENLMKYAAMVLVTVTMDGEYKPGEEIKEHELFALSKTTIDKLTRLAGNAGAEIEDIIYVKGNYRLDGNNELQFLEQNIFRYKAQVYKDDVACVSVTKAESPGEELEFIAGEICRLVREEGYRYRDISVVTGDVATYSRLGTKVMERYGIPVFMDYKRDVMHNPFIECIRAALAAVDDNYSFDSMFRFIKCGMLDIADEDIFKTENYCISKGIRGRKRWSEDWTLYNKSYFTGEDMERINGVRRKIFGLFDSLHQAFKGTSTVSVRCRALYRFLCDIRAQERLKEMEDFFAAKGERALEKEYSIIYKTVIDLLDEYVNLLGGEAMDTREFVQILDAGFAEARIGIIPPGMDMVTLGDITRTRLSDIKVLFFAGVNDGIIPAADAGAGIISQTERAYLSRKIDLAPTVREKSYIQRFYLYLNLTKPSDRLYVSYSALSADGSGIRPSYLIGVLTGMFGERILCSTDSTGDMAGIATPEAALRFFAEQFEAAREGDEDSLWRDLYRWYAESEDYAPRLAILKSAATFKYNPDEDNLGADLAVKLYGDMLKNSVTRLELFATCAFAHFLKRGLELKVRDEFEITPLEIGNMVHDSLERFTQKLFEEKKGWNDIPEDMLSSMAEECVNDTAESMFTDLFKYNARNEYMINRIKRIMKRTVWALYKQMRSGDFEQLYAEKIFDYNLGDNESEGDLKVWVNGKIDRMDIYKAEDRVYVKIIDYKTGNKSFDITEFYNGLSMQLGVYLEAAMRDMEREYPGKEIVPAGVFYYVTSDPLVDADASASEEEVKKLLLEDLRMGGLCNNDRDIIRLMDKDNEEGKSYVLPISLNKNGTVRESKSSISTKEFGLMRDYTGVMIKRIAGEILSGRAEANPFLSDKHSGCDYCEYKAVCRFDPGVAGYEERPCRPGSWEIIEEELRGKGGEE